MGMLDFTKLWKNENKEAKEPKDPEKMDLLMRTIKAAHDSAGNTLDPEELGKKRASTEMFSRLITPAREVKEEAFTVGEVPCEWVCPTFPHSNNRIILYCHGGGYVSGGLGYARILAAKLALHTGRPVVSFEYRLAPEHPYPAPLEDCMAVWDYLMKLGYGARDIVLAGDSAGGNLALELTLKLREEKRMLPAALVLFSPWTDMRASSSSYETYKDKDPLLTYDYIVAVRDAYIGAEADPALPIYSPLLADMKGMPPMLVQVGSNEILRKDSEHLVKKLTSAGVPAKLEVYKDSWHVFQQMPMGRANFAMDSVHSFLQEVVHV